MILSMLTLGLATTVSGSIKLNGKPAKDAVIWFSSKNRVKPIKAEIVQKDKAFIPRILAVTVGSEVSFPNRDDIFHNVFAEYRAKKFDLGMYPKGQTRKVVFDKPGVVSVLCNIHSNMSAYVIVLESAHFAKSDSQGRFTVNNITGEISEYEVWHESGANAKGFWKNGPLEIQLTR
jgi:plastocyanin